MCEFCIKHGEGQKWYLAMQNYSRELWAHHQRAKFMENFGAHFEDRLCRSVPLLDAVKDVPVVYNFVRRMVVRKEKAMHWGQVVPIEDVEEIVNLLDSVVRMPCACRSLTTGLKTRYCFGIGIDMAGILGKYPDYNDFEVLDREEAKNVLRSFDKQGIVHSVWTFKTPYIGAICNCDQDCLAYRLQVKTNLVQLMFRSEYVALVNLDLCNGCKRCMPLCQFGAIRYSNATKRVTIGMNQCYGCGICRTACEKRAITLKPRTNFATLPW